MQSNNKTERNDKMTNNILPDDNIQNTEDPMPESVKNLISARVYKELTENDEKEKEKRK